MGRRSRGARRPFRAAFLALLFILPAGIARRAPAQAPAVSLRDLLQRAGKQIELFQQQFPATKCTEKLLQVKFGQKGNIISRQQTEADYLILMSMEESNLVVEESRIVTKSPDKKTNASLLVSGGFSTMILIFHPLYQSSFEFMLMPPESEGGDAMVHLRFQHVPGTRSTAALRMEKRDLPLDLKGDAWILPESATIVRIVAELSAPLPDVGLKMFNADVRYGPIRFSTAENAYWLPTTAAIEVTTNRQHWRNTHQFEEYRRFSVSTGSVINK